jgi:hypothetical protein
VAESLLRCASLGVMRWMASCNCTDVGMVGKTKDLSGAAFLFPPALRTVSFGPVATLPSQAGVHLAKRIHFAERDPRQSTYWSKS